MASGIAELQNCQTPTFKPRHRAPKVRAASDRILAT
jgi:hypothetical protein